MFRSHDDEKPGPAFAHPNGDYFSEGVKAYV
jgi:hypothetical protein